MTPHEFQKPDGAPRSDHQLRECGKCGNSREPEGGVELSPGKWRCRACWHAFTMRNK